MLSEYYMQPANGKISLDIERERKNRRKERVFIAWGYDSHMH